MVSRRAIRSLFVLLLIGTAIFLTYSFLTSETKAQAQLTTQSTGSQQATLAAPRDNITVMTGHGFGNRSGTALTAIAPNGSLLYYNNTYDSYFDVDPSAAGKHTVLVVANDKISATACHATEPCVKNVIERVNLSTKNHTRLYTLVYPQHRDGNVHDVDRISDDRLLIADIANDRAFILNTTSRLIEWEWEATSSYSRDTGGSWPSKCQFRSVCSVWTHINDVELIRGERDRIMVTLRNHDQTVFINRTTGVSTNWTLGADDNYSILNEHHNSDYIPAENGGPAVIVADSRNNRLVEYQRVNGSWIQTWEWRDAALRWPRDADRLPNGHTLVVDSNGGRLFEIDESGTIVWRVQIKSLYDAERLGTGDESQGGPSAAAADIRSRTYDPGTDTQNTGILKTLLRAIIPETIRSAVAFVLPHWMWWSEVVALFGFVLSALGWVVAELYWSRFSVSIRSPIRLHR